MEKEDYTVNIGGAAITSITTAKTGIDLGNENQFQMYYTQTLLLCLERKND
jgi:hypothetical protein